MTSTDDDRADARRAKYAVPALEKALDVLELLSAHAAPMTQAQLARALGRQPTEIFRTLTLLETRGYLRRDGAGGAYSLTLKLFELSRTHSPHEELLQVARPQMQALAEAIRESCHLSVLHNDRVLVLAQAESPAPFRLSVEVGSMHDPLRTASGRLLLALLGEAELEALLDRRGLAVGEREGLRRRLAAIREGGFERTESERFVGGLDLGAPIGARGGQVRAALTIATLKTADGPDLDALLPSLKACAGAIAAGCGLESGPPP